MICKTVIKICLCRGLPFNIAQKNMVVARLIYQYGQQLQAIGHILRQYRARISLSYKILVSIAFLGIERYNLQINRFYHVYAQHINA